MTPLKVKIVQARKTDKDFIVQSQLAMAMESEGLKLKKKVLTRGVEALFKDPGKGTYYVAYQGTQRMGCLLVVPEWSDWRNRTVLWIHSLYVVPGARRSGVFRSFYQHLKAKVLRSKQLAGLRLYVEKSNHKAQKAYRNVGMNPDHYQLYEWLK